MSLWKKLEEKDDSVMMPMGLIVSGVLVYFLHKWVIAPLGNAFHLGGGWIWGITLFVFFAGFGFWNLITKAERVLDKADKKK